MISDNQINLCLENLRNGKNKADSAKMAGFSEKSFYRLKHDREGFAEKVEEAELEFKYSCLDDIKAADSWQSKAWILERRYRDEYGKDVMKSDDALPKKLVVEIVESI